MDRTNGDNGNNGMRHDAWRLDRRVGVQALAAAATAFAGAVMLVATVQARLDAMEARAASMDGDLRVARESVVCVARMDERLAAVQRALEEMRTDLRHLRAEPRASSSMGKEDR